MANWKDDGEAAQALNEGFKSLQAEIGKVVIGQDQVVRSLLISIFSQGHSLLVGVPGLAKTLLIQTVSRALDLSFNRIQFTPDLMPSDIVGSETMDQNRNFKFVQGPIFANIILADEINRTPPKTQAALLESMQEYAVTVAGQKYPLEKPFFVLATQNPIEQEGTYPLPEAQLDRFMFNLKVGYPSFEDEVRIVEATTTDVKPVVNKVMGKEEIIAFQELVRRVPVTRNVAEYAVRLVSKTRPNTETASKEANDFLEWGAGPRASQSLILAAKCHSLMAGKFSPDIEDVRAIALEVLRHRVVRNFKAEAEGHSVEELIRRMM
jgi:MoxR-like ATPase